MLYLAETSDNEKFRIELPGTDSNLRMAPFLTGSVRNVEENWERTTSTIFVRSPAPIVGKWFLNAPSTEMNFRVFLIGTGSTF
jgi:hypothetical protein